MRVPYTCCRCGYETTHKGDMRHHLYKRKRMCPATENKIELTDEIKEEILENHIYRVPKEKESKITNNNTINNNTVNIVISMDVVDKITKLSHYNKCRVKSIEASIYNNYCKQIEILDTGEKDIRLKEKDFYDILNNITTFKDINGLKNLNIIYDESTNKLRLYEGKNLWIDEMVEFGILKLVDLIHENYLHRYEMYLLKKIHNDDLRNLREKVEYRDALKNYYRFIGIFDVKPYCLEKRNSEILDNDDPSYSIEETSQALYDDIAVPKSEIRNTKKLLVDLLKTNGKNTIKELNKIILDSIKVDKKFKEIILEVDI